MVLTSQLLATGLFLLVLAHLGFTLWRRFVKQETLASGKPWPDNAIISIDVVTVIVFGFVMVFSWLYATNPFM